MPEPEASAQFRMQEAEATEVLRQRIRPSLFDYCYLATRSHLRTFYAFRAALAKRGSPARVLDLGCGQKPFRRLFADAALESYVGVDFDDGVSKPDIVAPAWKLPLPDDCFDAVIATEVFEHILLLEDAIAELRRVSRNGALVYISTPFMFPEHGVPYDFQRPTRYKYRELFRRDEILHCEGTNTSVATPFYVANVCWSLSPAGPIPLLSPLVYALNNAVALALDTTVRALGALGARLFSGRRESFQRWRHTHFNTMPAAFNLIVRIRK